MTTKSMSGNSGRISVEIGSSSGNAEEESDPVVGSATTTTPTSVDTATAAPDGSSRTRSKAAWRESMLSRRAAVSAQRRAADAAALAAAVSALAADVVCAYVPFGTEPGSLAMLDALVAAGARVLLPVTGGARALRWAAYAGADTLTPGRFGIPVPTTEPLPPRALAAAGVVLIPALAVDRRGVRLGRGAGHYDRTLGYADPAARLIAVVRDEELVDELPAEPHDVRVGWALTPAGGLTRVGGAATPH